MIKDEKYYMTKELNREANTFLKQIFLLIFEICLFYVFWMDAQPGLSNKKNQVVQILFSNSNIKTGRHQIEKNKIMLYFIYITINLNNALIS